MVRPLILLDFDGVLFNSAYEAYRVCEAAAESATGLRKGVSFDDFMSCRANLTDAWQFSRLYIEARVLSDFSKLHEVTPDEQDWAFAEKFFAARAELIKDPDWAKLMSPYPFFHQLRPHLLQYPETFKILSTRNRASIQRTLEFFDATGIDIFGQEDIRAWGSKHGVARQAGWFESGQYLVYVDDMRSHLEPFESQVHFCIHAGWGYDVAHGESYTQGQAFKIIDGILKVAFA
jgi:hypothetical protein